MNSLPKTQETVFPKSSLYRRNKTFHDRMKRLSEIHSNPRFTKIHYHTLRHCKALREYHRTRDILHVKRILVHKSINTTMVYVDIYQEIYSEDSPKQFLTKIASTKQERCQLINDGWDLVEKDGEDWYFKRPK